MGRAAREQVTRAPRRALQKAKQGDVFDDFESYADRLADWIRRNALLLGGGVVLLILLVWGIQLWRQGAQGRAEAASAALAEARVAYQTAMGVDPESGQVAELANPEAAARIEARYRESLQAVAEAHAGSVAGTLARLEVLELTEAEIGPEKTLAALAELLEGLPRNAPVRGVVMLRLAGVQEDAGQLEQAAATYEALSDLSGYPLRNFALADAARCFAQLQDPQRALALYDRLEARAPGFQLSEEHRALVRELRAAAER